jgi:hypothetical protein
MATFPLLGMLHFGLESTGGGYRQGSQSVGAVNARVAFAVIFLMIFRDLMEEKS